MKNPVTPATVAKLLVFAVTSSALLVQGCAAGQRRGSGPSQAQTVMGCQRCYKLALTFQRDVDKHWPWTRPKPSAKHMCEGCSSHIELYTLDGKPMIRCPHCAPTGQACNRCRPPEPLVDDKHDTSGE